MANASLPHAIRTLFADLLQQVEIAAPAGSTYKRQRDGISYQYAKIPVGSDRIDLFLGRSDDPATLKQVTDMREAMRSARSRRRIVAMLRRAGLAGPDRTLGSILDALAHASIFRNGAVLVGTAAYLLSEALVGQLLPAPTLMTGDLDLATARLALTAEPPQRMQDILRRADASFDGILQLDPRKPSSRFRNSDNYLVEILTPIRSRLDSNPMPLKALDAGAIPLQYLAWLIEDPVSTVALWGAGVPVTVPQPARYAIHKLIVAQRRDPSNRPKRMKDLAQAKAIMAALGREDPFALEDALEDARGRGKTGWSDLIDRSLREVGQL